MTPIETLVTALAESWIQEVAVYLLGNVPGLPPIAQSLHILGIATVMGSVVMIDLKLLGVALPTQSATEMIRRLMPWTGWALLLNLVTGSVFVMARPDRYFFNPLFRIKFSLLIPAVALAFVVYRLDKRESDYWDRSVGRRLSGGAIAAVSLVLWIGVVLAGRWVAYADYLFYE